MKLTDRQKQVYDYVRDYEREQGRTPKLREIAEFLGIRSRGSVHRYVQALVQAGLIEIEPDRSRGIRLLQDVDSSNRFTLPLLGRIAAGLPIEAIPDQDEIDLSEFFIRPNRFVLKVTGDSMIEAGILDGDMVVVEQASTARDGDIVVALIDREEATLKTFRRNPDKSISLVPSNASMKTMRYAADRVQIQGIVVGQMRSYR
ncbi:MAG: transcriptional repressor LexA [Acidiferrobacterales bacterium]|nr:transcriptional repressor LexA [Acidiferrobacterales bacterium]